ncbi:MAG: hypothetical protein CMJ19_19670 [Phycisphaeraceae bacterium]|nr:hypothetical protein [Phycisphaeraceae bacterium]
MTHTITDSNLLEKRKLTLSMSYVSYTAGVAFSSAKKFGYDEIDSLVLSDTHELTIGIGTSLYTIGINPKKVKHTEAVQYLVDRVRATVNHKMPNDLQFKKQ